MPRSKNIYAEGLEAHVTEHTNKYGGIGYQRLIYYIDHGDHFGKKYSVQTLADACHCSKNTMVKWLRVDAIERPRTEILNESLADAIVKENIAKEKEQEHERRTTTGTT